MPCNLSIWRSCKSDSIYLDFSGITLSDTKKRFAFMFPLFIDGALQWHLICMHSMHPTWDAKVDFSRQSSTAPPVEPTVTLHDIQSSGCSLHLLLNKVKTCSMAIYDVEPKQKCSRPHTINSGAFAWLLGKKEWQRSEVALGNLW